MNTTLNIKANVFPDHEAWLRTCALCKLRKNATGGKTQIHQKTFKTRWICAGCFAELKAKVAA